MVAWVIEGEAQGVFVGGIPPAETLGSQDILECFFKLLTRTRVNDGVDAAVQIPKPKGNFKNGLGRLAVRKERT